MRSVVRASHYSLHNMFFHLRALKLRRQKLQDVPTTSPKKSVDKTLISILVRSPVPVPFSTTSDLLSISYEGCVEFLSWNEMGHGTLILGFAKMFCRVRPGNVPNFKTHVHSFLNSVFSYSRGQFNYLKTFIKKTIAGLKRRWLSVWCSIFRLLWWMFTVLFRRIHILYYVNSQPVSQFWKNGELPNDFYTIQDWNISINRRNKLFHGERNLSLNC